MDLEARRRGAAYTRAKDVMPERSHIPESRWWVVQTVDQMRASLHCIHHRARHEPRIRHAGRAEA